MSKQKSSPIGCLVFILLIMILGFTGFFIFVIRPQSLRVQQIKTELGVSDSASSEPSPNTTYSTNEDNINVEACKNLTDENTKPCADFADKCYRIGKIVEQWDWDSASIDPGVTECKRKGWTYNNKY